MIKRIAIMRVKGHFLWSIFFGILFLTTACSPKRQKVACVGDSITHGARLENRHEHSYPAQLQLLLGKKYKVENFGVSSCTLLKKGQPNVWNELPKIKAFLPKIIIISLGTNDTCDMETCNGRKCWEYHEDFKQDYRDLIQDLSSLPSKPKIYLCAPTPMVMETPNLSAERMAGLSVRKPRLLELVVQIKNIAEEKKVGFIDLNTSLDHKPQYFTVADGVHPNKEGYLELAKLVNRGIQTKPRRK